jgi:hypothetical protein
MYCHCNPTFFCILGIVGIVCVIIQFIIILCLAFALYNLIFKRICIEPVHHPDGDYCWAITKNGKPCKWLRKKKK